MIRRARRDAMPRAGRTKPAFMLYGLSVLRALLIPGIVQAIHQDGEVMIRIGSVLTILTVLLFFVTIPRHREVQSFRVAATSGRRLCHGCTAAYPSHSNRGSRTRP